VSFGGHLDAIWEDFGKFGTRLTITSFLYRFGADFGFLLCTLLETIPTYWGHVCPCSCQKCRCPYGH